MIDELIRALKDNSQLQKLLLANVKFSEDHALVSASCRREGGRWREIETKRERERERERGGGGEREREGWK